jgi:hypothetical protein
MMAESVLRYIKKKIEQLDENIDKLEEFSDDTEFNKRLRQDLVNITDSYEDTNLKFDDYWSMYKHHFQTLKKNNVSGIFVLMDVPDSEGVYSVGEAVDILALIDIIRPYLPENTPYLQQIIDVFQECVETKTHITTW